jgi:hypothetical protein
MFYTVFTVPGLQKYVVFMNEFKKAYYLFDSFFEPETCSMSKKPVL